MEGPGQRISNRQLLKTFGHKGVVVIRVTDAVAVDVQIMPTPSRTYKNQAGPCTANITLFKHVARSLAGDRLWRVRHLVSSEIRPWGTPDDVVDSWHGARQLKCPSRSTSRNTEPSSVFGSNSGIRARVAACSRPKNRGSNSAAETVFDLTRAIRTIKFSHRR